MGLPSVGDTLEYLRAAGIRAERGYPGRLMPHLTGPVVAVNIHQAELYRRTFAGEVCAPMKLGAFGCEDLAFRVADLWRSKGAECHYKTPRFDEHSGVYILPVYGTWDVTPEAT